MNASIFRRLIWKEYRVQRAFGLAAVVLTVFLQMLLLLSASLMEDSRWVSGGSQRIAWLFGFALAIPAFYALGCGATMFATEHETGTFQFQRMLPVSAMRLFLGKVVFALVSTLLMFVVLWPIAAVLAGWTPVPCFGMCMGLSVCSSSVHEGLNMKENWTRPSTDIWRQFGSPCMPAAGHRGRGTPIAWKFSSTITCLAGQPVLGRHPS